MDRHANRMQTVVNPVSLLLLGSAWVLQTVTTLPEMVTFAQDNFDLGRFMGQWYEVAAVSTCPHYMRRKRGNPVIVAVELHHVASEGNFTMTFATFRNGSCKQMSIDYVLTDIPGQFFYHVAWLGADVDSYVVHTNYTEYAVMLLLSTQKPSLNKTTIVKLYSRTMGVSPAVLDIFKTLVRKHGMSDDTIIMNQKKGECVPGEQVPEPTPQPQISVPMRSNRGSVVPPVDSGKF